MSLFAQPPVTVSWIGFIKSKRDTEIRVMIGDELSECPLPIGFIGQNRGAAKDYMLQQLLCDSDVIDISGCPLHIIRIAQRAYYFCINP